MSGTPMPNLTSQFCCVSLLAICLARQIGAFKRPHEYPWASDGLENEATVKVDYELLAMMYT